MQVQLRKPFWTIRDERSPLNAVGVAINGTAGFYYISSISLHIDPRSQPSSRPQCPRDYAMLAA
jgi:hypothetical protein